MMTIPIAYIFPGQGAQKAGMGKEFYDASPQAKAVFDEADAILETNLSDVTFNGPQEKLTTTAYSQPAILTFSIAALRALQAHEKFQSLNPRFAAGLSLGEYSALAASGALSFADTLRLVRKRSAYMEEATLQSKGAMAAIIGMDRDAVVKICEETGAEVANFNSPQQIVITGEEGKVKAASEALSQAGAKSVIPLDVSGAFHSSLMAPAAEKFLPDLKAVTFNKPDFPVVANVNGQPADDPSVICDNLSTQITSSVQWVETIQNIAAQGVTTFLEIGPGTVLKGLIKRIDRSLTCHSIQTPADIEALP